MPDPVRSPGATSHRERPLLTIGYSALAARVGDITLPAVDANIEVVVCVQGGEPAVPLPPGARLVPVPGVGVSRSRNAAIDAAGGRYLLFCDDDVTVDMSGVMAGVQHLESSGRALALGRAVNPSGLPRKTYPTNVVPLSRFNSAKAATYEMLIDVDRVRTAGLQFDERFGAGSQCHLGDEYIFIADLLAAGLPAEAVPFVFGTHPEHSSGTNWDRPDVHARALALNRVFNGVAAPVVRAAFAFRHRRSLGGWRGVIAFANNRTQAPPHGASGHQLELPPQ